jgi:hypothetical protein
MFRTGILFLASLFGALSLGCGRAVADTTEPAAPCQPFANNAPPDKVYRLEKETCDVTAMAVAAHDGNFRSLYGPEVDYKPADEQAILTILDGIDTGLQKAATAQLPADGSCRKPCAVTVKVLLFAHGGLVSQDGALAEAQSIAPGALADHYQPIFLIWNSDFPGAYGERLCCVLAGEQSKRGLPYFFPVRLAGDIAAGLARAPEYYGQQLIRFDDSVVRQSNTEYYLSTSDPTQLCQILGASACDHISYPPFADYRTLNGLDEPIEEKSGLYRILFPVRLGTTVAAQIGAESWDDMVRRTRLAMQPAFSPDPGLLLGETPLGPTCDRRTRAALEGIQALRNHAAQSEGSAYAARFSIPSEGAFSIFADHLQCEIENNLELDKAAIKVNVELYYFGHSMGAIVGDQLISSFPKLPWKQIVYMAAADTTRDFRETVAPLLNCNSEVQHGGCLSSDVQFHSLMLHPLAESHDLEYWGILPEGSLLEWIDEMFNGPRSIDDRTFGKWTNVEQSIAFLPAPARAHMYFRVFPAQWKLRGGSRDENASYEAQCATAPDAPASESPPARCHPIKHGEFAAYSFWRDDFLVDPCDRPGSCPP